MHAVCLLPEQRARIALLTQGVRAAEDLDEMNIEIMRNTLYKAYLDDFAAFCRRLGGATAEVMGGLLSFEARLPPRPPRQAGLFISSSIFTRL